MKKRLLFSSAVLLSTLACSMTPVVSAATTSNENTQNSNNQNNNDSTQPKTTTNPTNVITGPAVKEADKTVAQDNNAATTPEVSTPVTSSIDTFAAIAPAALSVNQQAFVNQAGPMAQKSASKYKLYASVMMAQAILESGWGASSLAMAPNFNLFGIKGDYHGSSVSMPTQEWSSAKGWYTINANFRKYPSYEQSFDDNGDKLRNGISGAPEFYKGTWKENTKSYKDATAWLQGRYATSPTYAASLNSIIEAYNLTKYDTGVAGGDTPTTQPPVALSKTAKVININGAVVYSKPDINTRTTTSVAHGTSWHVDQYADDSSNHRFYRIGTDKYVLSNDISLSDVDNNTNEPNYTLVTGAVVVNSGIRAQVYNYSDEKKAMVPVSGKKFEAKSAWYTDKSVNTKQGMYYRVSTNEWLKLDTVTFLGK